MSKNTVISKETQRAVRKIAHRDSFIARNYGLWIMVAWVFYPLSAIFSALTEGGHVYLRMQTSMGSGFAAIAVTVILILIIEGLKYLLGKGAIDDIQAGVFSESGAYRAAFAVKVLGFIGVMAFSITLSIQGAPELNRHLRESSQPVQAKEVSLDSINQQYDQTILPHRDNIATYEQTTWKGKIVSEARQMILAEQKAIELIEARRSEELALAREENKQINAAYATRTTENGQWAMGFAGLGEVVCLFCLIFIGIYDDGLAREAEKQNAAASRQSPAPPWYAPNGHYQQIPYPSPANGQNTERRPVGFRLPQHGPEEAPAATGNYRAADDSEDKMGADHQLTVKTLVAAYKKSRSEYQAWAAKLDQGRGKPATNQRHMDELQLRMQGLAEKLEKYGVEVEQLINKRR